MNKEEEMPVSLIMDEHEDALDCGVELLCQRPRRMLWIAVRDGRRVVYKGLPENMRGRIEETSALRKEYLLGLKVFCFIRVSARRLLTCVQMSMT